MNITTKRKVFMTFCVAFCLVNVLQADENLYDVLGVKKTASSSDIKKAYKNLAKEWHPDKNKDPSANEKFMKINEAYETLMDPDKRREYDQFGRTTATQGEQRWGGGGARFQRGFNFDSFFGGGSPFGSFGGFNFGGFNFGSDFESNVDKYMINLRTFENKILPESKIKPYLLYVYRDFCFACMEVEKIWDRIVQDLETIGMGLGSVNIQLDPHLTRRLRISSIPTVLVVMDGKTRYYSGSYNIPNIREFIRSLLKDDLVTKVTKSNIDEFLTGWEDNKVRTLFFDNRPQPTLRYQMAAFAFRNRVAAGYVNMAEMATFDIQTKFKAAKGMETLMIFKENIEQPVATSNMQTLSRGVIDEVIEANKYLLLPRLSSQKVFNELCPTSTKQKKMLCVVLLSQKTPAHDSFRESFREHASQHVSYYERVKYVYLYEDTQQIFVKELTDSKGVVNATTNSLKVAVVWRNRPELLHYDFLEGGWPDKQAPDFDDGPARLVAMVQWILGSQKNVLPFEMKMHAELSDEGLESIWVRVLQRLIDWGDRIYEKAYMFYYTMDEVTMVTIIAMIFIVITFLIMMKSMVSMEDARLREYDQSENLRAKAEVRKQRADQRTSNNQPTVYIHPLCSENFDKLVLSLEPGVRTIVLLVDEPRKHKLLQSFAQSVHPYSNTEAFNFAFLQLEQYSNWYRHLLEQTLDFKRDLAKMNIRNCVGTVLAINGYRKYYSVYHTQKEPTHKKVKTQVGRFIGFEESSDSESDGEKRVFENDLLSGLGVWMERLCEGTVLRFRVEYWPMMEAL